MQHWDSGTTGTVAVGQCQAVATLRTLSQSKEGAGRAPWRVAVQTVAVQTIAAPPSLCPAVLVSAFLHHCPGHTDLLASPVLSQAPCHRATHPAAASLVRTGLRLQPYKGSRDTRLGTSQPHGHGEQCLCPAPRLGPADMRHPFGEEGTGTAVNGDVTDVALGCSTGSWVFFLKCHFRRDKQENFANS